MTILKWFFSFNDILHPLEEQYIADEEASELARALQVNQNLQELKWVKSFMLFLRI